MGSEHTRRTSSSCGWLSQKHIVGAFAIMGLFWWMFLSKASPPQQINEQGQHTSQIPDSGTPPKPPIDLDDVAFAILVDDGYHVSRAQAIKQTWVSQVTHYHFFSSSELPDIPTTIVPGSSSRFFPALRYLLSNPNSKLLIDKDSQNPANKWRWLVIVDAGVFINLKNLADTIEETRKSEMDQFHIVYANNSEGYPSERRIHTFILNPEILEELSQCNSLMYDGSVYSTAPCREDHNNDNRLITCIEYFVRVGTTAVAERHLDLAVSEIIDWNDDTISKAVSLKNLSPEQMLQAGGKSSQTIGYSNNELSVNNIMFGVLTTAIWHESRVQRVIKPAWGDKVPLVAYYSETDDPDIPTTRVNSYTADAPEKECLIVYQAYAEYMENNEEVDWFVRVDDDTIVCPQNMVDLLSRYDPSEPYYIGSCYVHYGEQALLDFVPLGGGIALSRKAMEMMVEYIDTTLSGCENAPLTEDPNVWVAKVMRDLGVGCTNENGFNNLQMKQPDNDLVTVHYIRDLNDAIVLQSHHGCV